MEPSSSQPPTELVFSHDRLFALHGEIWLLVVLLVFALFLTIILFLPRLIRGRRPESEVSNSNNIPRHLISLRKPRGSDGDETVEEQQYSDRINHNFPLYAD
ncbi:hypothetical protein DITRI_Ditri14bG0089000 [Diplodiscus trichospermus]